MCLSARGQTDSLVLPADTLIPRIHQVLLVPYDDVMYSNEPGIGLDDSLGFSKDDLQQLVYRTILEQIVTAGDQYFDVTEIAHTGEPGGEAILKKVTWSIQRSYQSIPAATDRPELGPDSTETSPMYHLILSNIFMDKFDRYLRTTIYDKSLCDLFRERFGCDYVLFLSQVAISCEDTEKPINDPAPNCWLLMHYTFMDVEGDIKTGGIARVPFNEYKTGSAELTNELIPQLAQLTWWKITHSIY